MSVWPRGLPLENVCEICHEKYYTQVFGGMQYIQQGISNGLPDVDSVPKSWKSALLSSNSNWVQQAEMVKQIVTNMIVHFQVSYKESVKSDMRLAICSSEVSYIPRRFVTDYIDLVNFVGHLDIHQKVAIPMMLLSMDSADNSESIFNTMVYKRKKPSNSTTFYSPKAPAVHPWNVSSEQDFIKLIRTMTKGDPLLIEMV